jgi:hypothetical protein
MEGKAYCSGADNSVDRRPVPQFHDGAVSYGQSVLSQSRMQDNLVLQAVPVLGNFSSLNAVRRITIRVAIVILGLGIANTFLAWNGISCILLIAQAALLLRLASLLTSPGAAVAGALDADAASSIDDCDNACCDRHTGAWGDDALAASARTIRGLAIASITIACLEFIFGFAGGIGGSLLASNPEITCSVCSSSFCAQCPFAAAGNASASALSSAFVAVDKQGDHGFFLWAVWMGGANLAVSSHNIAASVLVLQLLSELAETRRAPPSPPPPPPDPPRDHRVIAA